MKRIAIDTDVVNFIADTPGLLQGIKLLGARGDLVIVGNHIVRDQLAATPETTRRGHLLAVYDDLPRQDVPTRGFVLDLSRLDEARLGDGSESGVSVDAVKTRGRGALQDALIATTASGDADVLVTNDGDLQSRVGRSTAACAVWTPQNFAAFVTQKK